MRTFNKVWPTEVLHAWLLNDWTSRSETSAHWRDTQGKILRGDVAAWWPSGKPQQQPEQCGQLPPQNEMLLSGQMCRVINSLHLCKLPQLHRSAKGWNVDSAQNAFRPARLFSCWGDHRPGNQPGCPSQESHCTGRLFIWLGSV